MLSGLSFRVLLAFWLALGIRAAEPEPAPAQQPSAASTASKKNFKREDIEAALEMLKLPGVKINVKELSVDVEATVCLRNGLRELIACTKDTKEHEKKEKFPHMPSST